MAFFGLGYNIWFGKLLYKGLSNWFVGFLSSIFIVLHVLFLPVLQCGTRDAKKYFFTNIMLTWLYYYDGLILCQYFRAVYSRNNMHILSLKLLTWFTGF